MATHSGVISSESFVVRRRETLRGLSASSRITSLLTGEPRALERLLK